MRTLNLFLQRIFTMSVSAAPTVNRPVNLAE
jgi:hypothetical protein